MDLENGRECKSGEVDGNIQVLGVVRRKFGCGDFIMFMSCSDKIVCWNVFGF